MTFYDNMAEVALAKITQFGREITITRFGSSNSDPAAGTVDKPVEATGTLKALVLPASKGTVEAFDNRLQGGSLIDEKLRYILAAAKGAPFEPRSLDEVSFDGIKWQVLGCTPLSPAGMPLLYKMGVMRS